MRNAKWLVVALAAGFFLIPGSPNRKSELSFAYADEEAAAPPVGTEPTRSPDTGSTRTRKGLQVLYDFSSASGQVVKDRAGVGKPVDLRISNPAAVRRASGSLEVRGETLIRSDELAAKITNSIRRSGEITIEAWLRSAKTSQSGPARIVTLSKNANERNFTLGQDGNRFDVRLRTTKTNANGIPALSSAGDNLTTRPVHVVYSRDRNGRARIYIDGEQSEERSIAGDTSNWNRSFRLALANELSKDRPWRGTYFLVAVYNRNLSPREVEQNYRAGAAAQPVSEVTQDKQKQLFETQIASLLARRCLECHDASVKGR